MIQNTSNLIKACNNIEGKLLKTPIMTSRALNEKFGHNFYFKMDCFQKTGAFKIRAVLNHLLELKKNHLLPPRIVTYSTGNHAIALSYACKILGNHCKIYLSKSTNAFKINMIKLGGSKILFTENRLQAEEMAMKEEDSYFLHPSDSDLSIAGSGTMCFEAIKQLDFKPDAIFAACGGGGLLSGSYLAKELLSPKTLLFGCEPQKANDAFLSFKEQKIFEFKNTPQSIADGLIALKLSKRTFEYIKKTDGILLSKEKEIVKWTILLNRLLKAKIEPSAAITMPCAINWLNGQSYLRKNILLLISGGNFNYKSLCAKI